MSVADKLLAVNQVKNDIKNAIEDKGVDMTDVPFTEYADKVAEISGVVELTQDAYDALTVKDPNTYYIIVEV